MRRINGAYRGVHIEGEQRPQKVYVCQDGPLEILRVRFPLGQLQDGETVELFRPSDQCTWAKDEATGTWRPYLETFIYRVGPGHELHYVGRPDQG